MFWCCLSNATLLSPHPVNQEQGVRPFANQHTTKWFPILQNWGILTFASCTSIQLIGDKMLGFPKYIRLSPRLISSPQSRQQIQSLGIYPIRQCWAVLPTWQYIVGSHLCDECMKLILPNVCHKLCVHLVTDLASLLTDHWMSGPQIRAKYKQFKTICEQTFDSFPTDSSSSFLK